LRTQTDIAFTDLGMFSQLAPETGKRVDRSKSLLASCNSLRMFENFLLF